METATDICPTCGSIESVHGDCLVCNAPLAARRTAVASAPGSSSALKPLQTAEDVVRALAGRVDPDVVSQHLAELPASYVSRTPAAAIGAHIALIERAAGRAAAEHSREDDVDQITIVASDRPGILQGLSGTLASHGINILSGAVHTKTTGLAIDVLSVARSESATASWDTVCGDVARVLDGELQVDEARIFQRAMVPAVASRIPTTVYIDNASSERFSRVEVNAADRVGLLYAVSRAMSGLGLDIHLAQVETFGTTTVDTFYLRHPDGSRIASQQEIQALKDWLLLPQEEVRLWALRCQHGKARPSTLNTV